jgi:hypothetical protein
MNQKLNDERGLDDHERDDADKPHGCLEMLRCHGMH